jgi:hypothetical protein
MSDDPRFHEAAEAIAGGNPPPWLVNVMQTAVSAICGNSETQANFPTRKAMRDRLENVRTSATSLMREFNEGSWQDVENNAVIAHLVASGLDLPTVNALILAIPKLAHCAASAAPIREGKGRDKTFPNPDAPSAYQQCAAFVVWGWFQTKGSRPPHTSKEAHDACEAVWKSTGLPRAHFGNNLTGWRDHLEAVGRNVGATGLSSEADWPLRSFWDGLTRMADLSRNEGKPATKPQAKQR